MPDAPPTLHQNLRSRRSRPSVFRTARRLVLVQLFAIVVALGGHAGETAACVDDVATAPVATAPGATAPEAQTVGILGASVSAGYGMFIVGPGGDGPGIVAVRLSDAIRPLAPVGSTISDWSTSMFFRDPVSIGKDAVERLAEQSPDVVLAIDFLFWFGYGAVDAQGRPIEDDRQRDELFEAGLSLLRRFEVPIIVGDLPDMRGASRRILSLRQIPEAETLARLNARLRQWAAEHDSVAVVSLEEIRRAELAGPARQTRRRMQADGLHPTFTGLMAILAAAASPLEASGVVRQGTLTAEPPELVADRLTAALLQNVPDPRTSDAAPAASSEPMPQTTSPTP